MSQRGASRMQKAQQASHSTTPSSAKVVEVLHHYQAQERHQLTLAQGEKLTVLEKDPSGWWIGRNAKGSVGIFPSTYVREVHTAPPPAEALKEIAAARLANKLGLSGSISSTMDSPDIHSRGLQEEDQDIFALSEDELLVEARRETKRRDGLVDETQAVMSAIIAEQTRGEIDDDDDLGTDDSHKTLQFQQQLNIVSKRKSDLVSAERRLMDDIEDMLYDMKQAGVAVPSVLKPGAAPSVPASASGAPTAGSNVPVAPPAEPVKKRIVVRKKVAPPLPAEKPDWLAEVEDPKAVLYLMGLEKQFRTMNDDLDRLEKDLETLLKECKQGEAAAAQSASSAQEREKQEQETLTALEQQAVSLQDESKRLKRSVKDKVEAHERKCNALEEEARQLDQRMEDGKAHYLKMQEELEQLSGSADEKFGKIEAIRAETGTIQAATRELEQKAASRRGNIEAVVGSYKKTVAEKKAQYRSLERERRVIYNEIQELKGNLRVYCRIKPCLGDEVNEHVQEIDDMTLRVFDENTLRESSYEFDLVLGEDSTQPTIFEEVRPLATSVLDGYNVCIFAYGQTGSGKTYTMEGPPTDRGVNYRTIKELFGIAKERGEEYHVNLSVSVIEVYNNVAYDLQNERASVKVRFASEQGVVCDPLVKSPVGSADDVQRLLDSAYSRRQVAGTSCNEHSSRSHCILTVYVEATNVSAHSEIRGKLHLIDLAGSERVKHSKVEGDRLKEATHINTSLTHLKTVLQALASKKSHVSYRNSILTSLLQDSLGGNCKCLMFANISPLTPNIPETICTLKYASEARKVEVGKATANIRNSDASPASPGFMSPSTVSPQSPGIGGVPCLK